MRATTVHPLPPLLLLTFTLLHSSILSAQAPSIQSPGKPGTTSQTDRFSNEFNPALSLVIDATGDHMWFDDDEATDGASLDLRRAELMVSSYIDPKAWAWAVVGYHGDALNLEEAAIEYIGFESHLSLRGGRFFVDFGKQMQAHPEELRTTERPAVLRAYLGEELAGDGAQLDNWHAVGQATLVRYSVGVFQSLVGHHHEDAHAHDGSDHGVEPFVEDRLGIGELSLTGRLTALRDVGEHGTFQAGASARHLPEFSLVHDELQEDGLQNTVWGLDLTYAHVDDTGIKTWTGGCEALLLTGDVGGHVHEAESLDGSADQEIEVLDDDLWGFYAYLDRAWDQYNSAGVQLSWHEAPEAGTPEVSELDVYYTRMLSEFQRLRLGATVADHEDQGESYRLMIQYTAFIGPHGHGINW